MCSSDLNCAPVKSAQSIVDGSDGASLAGSSVDGSELCLQHVCTPGGIIHVICAESKSSLQGADTQETSVVAVEDVVNL